MDVRTLVAICTLACGAHARAAEWSVPARAEANAPLAVARVVADGDGYVLAGTDVRFAPRWVRVGADGSAIPSVAPSEVSLDPAGTVALRALDADRFLVGPDAGPNGCRMRIVDAAGRVIAGGSAEAATCASSSGIAHQAAARDATGGVWIALTNAPAWLRMQADGTLRPVAVPRDMLGPIPGPSPLAGESAAYALYPTAVGPRLAKVGADGSTAWSVSPPADVRFRGPAVTLANDDVLVAGETGALQEGPLVLLRYAPDGALRWQRTYPAIARGVVGDARVLPEGQFVVVVQSFVSGALVPSIVGFDAAGDVRWRLDPGGGDRFAGFVPGHSGDPRQAPAAFAYFVSRSVEGFASPRIVAIEHVRAADGTRIARHAADDTTVLRAAVLRDGSLVHAGPAASGIAHHDIAAELRPVPDLGALVALAPEALRGHVAQDGHTFSLVRAPSDGTQRLELRAYDADGRHEWTTPLSISVGPNEARSGDRAADRPLRIASNAERVCIGPAYAVFRQFVDFLNERHIAQCLRRSDGTRIYAVPLPSPGLNLSLYPEYLPAIAVRADGSVVLTDAIERVVVAPDGATMQRTPLVDAARLDLRGAEPGINAAASIAQDGSLAVVAPRAGGGLLAVVAGSDGAVRIGEAPGIDAGALLRVDRFDDGGFVLHAYRDGVDALYGFRVDGRLAWVRRYAGDPATTPRDGDVVPFAFAAGAGRILVATQRRVADRVEGAVEALDAASGATAWRAARASIVPYGVSALAIALDPPRALVARNGSGRPVLAVHALDDGRELGRRALSCHGVPNCAARSLAAANDGSARRFGGTVLAERIELARTTAPASIAQAAAAGTWYSPATSGQGLVIDYGAGTRDLFAGWFTHALDGPGDAAGLRWFTLGGRVEGDARAATLDIHLNTGGRFASPPITTAQRVGRATLRMNDCREMVLTYRFESGELAGLEGDVDLTRLTPATRDCTEADGSIVPALATGTAAPGVSAAQSGAWFSPATGGQGLLFDVVPPSGNDRGHLFAGWFTYDADEPDDPTAQHWFVLDGDLAPPRDGAFAVPILRAAGGAFDRRATRNVQRVGTATLRFTTCGAATLEYRFDATDVAGPFAAREGRIDLVKLLRCGE